MVDDLDLKSDFDGDGRSGYDLNDYTQGEYDDKLGTGGDNSPKKLVLNPLPKREANGSRRGEPPRADDGRADPDDDDDDDDPGTCTDIGDHLDMSDEE